MRGSRLAVATLVVASVGVLAALWLADRAMAEFGAAAAGTPSPAAERLRVASWVLGTVALAAAALGVLHERGVAYRTAERSAELERLSAELMQANRAKSEFLANVSHELRTPLNAVVGFTDLLQDDVYGELTPRQAGPVQRIAASATHLRHLVDQILDLAKIAAGRLEVHPEQLSVRPFALEVAGEIESLVHEKGLALSITVPASLPRLRSDPLHVRQVLVNLLGNAVKFTPAGGRVSLRGALVDAPPGRPPFAPEPPMEELGWRARIARRRQARGGDSRPPVSWIALQVIDTGVGIAPPDQARIFDEFEQLGPRTGDGAVRGTGLGLAISRRLARLLGGDLTLESASGTGSTFTLWLPVDPLDARPAAVGERRGEERRASDRRRVDRRDTTPV